MRNLLVALSLSLVSVGLAHGQAPFYQGKSITIIVGYLSGDGYDIWARLLAAHMGKHIPGNPGFAHGIVCASRTIVPAAYRFAFVSVCRSACRCSMFCVGRFFAQAACKANKRIDRGGANARSARKKEDLNKVYGCQRNVLGVKRTVKENTTGRKSPSRRS